MINADATPVFERNFDGFMNYLRDADSSPASISPKRFGLALRVDMQTLAARAHVHRNTLSRAPEAESVQRYLRESVRVMRAAVDVSGDVEQAIYWYKNNPLPLFDYKTPEDLVSAGRTDALIIYLQSLQAGFAG
jgi:uncharacterized protein (DUF2384 family)